MSSVSTSVPARSTAAAIAPLGRFAARAALLTLICYAGLLGVLYWRQEALLFFPSPLPADHRFDLPGVEEVFIPVEGATLHALHYRQREAKGVVFFLHGNGGSLKSWFRDLEFYRRTGYDLFMLDYRGYGKSTGRIESETQLHADVMAAWMRVAPEYGGRKRVIFGVSLGTGPAARLATEVDTSLLVLVAPYESLRAMARQLFPWVPRHLLRYPMRTDRWLAKVKAPVLMLHGARDDVIPFSHALQLKLLNPRAELLRVEGAGHFDLHRFPQYEERLAARLGAL